MEENNLVSATTVDSIRDSLLYSPLQAREEEETMDSEEGSGGALDAWLSNHHLIIPLYEMESASTQILQALKASAARARQKFLACFHGRSYFRVKLHIYLQAIRKIQRAWSAYKWRRNDKLEDVIRKWRIRMPRAGPRDIAVVMEKKVQYILQLYQHNLYLPETINSPDQFHMVLTSKDLDRSLQMECVMQCYLETLYNYYGTLRNAKKDLRLGNVYLGFDFDIQDFEALQMRYEVMRQIDIHKKANLPLLLISFASLTVSDLVVAPSFNIRLRMKRNMSLPEEALPPTRYLSYQSLPPVGLRRGERTLWTNDLTSYFSLRLSRGHEAIVSSSREKVGIAHHDISDLKDVDLHFCVPQGEPSTETTVHTTSVLNEKGNLVTTTTTRVLQKTIFVHTGPELKYISPKSERRPTGDALPPPPSTPRSVDGEMQKTNRNIRTESEATAKAKQRVVDKSTKLASLVGVPSRAVRSIRDDRLSTAPLTKDVKVPHSILLDITRRRTLGRKLLPASVQVRNAHRKLRPSTVVDVKPQKDRKKVSQDSLKKSMGPHLNCTAVDETSREYTMYNEAAPLVSPRPLVNPTTAARRWYGAEAALLRSRSPAIRPPCVYWGESDFPRPHSAIPQTPQTPRTPLSMCSPAPCKSKEGTALENPDVEEHQGSVEEVHITVAQRTHPVMRSSLAAVPIQQNWISPSLSRGRPPCMRDVFGEVSALTQSVKQHIPVSRELNRLRKIFGFFN